MKRRSITMRRRAFVLSATAGLLVPLNARAQQRRRIGALLIVGPDSDAGALVWAALLEGLRTYGWIEGGNLEIVVRASGGDSRKLPDLANELTAAGVELLIARDLPSAQALLQRTRTVPIIMIGGTDLVEGDLVSSLPRPGGNVTGLTEDSADLYSKPVEFFRELVPGLRRAAFLFNPEIPGALRGLRKFETLASTAGVEVISVPVATSEQLEPALAIVAHERPQALAMHPAPPIALLSSHIAEFGLRHRIITLGPTRLSVRDDGHLFHYGPDYEESHRRTAYYVDRILRGAAPRELPLELTTMRLTINLATARALGVTVPAFMLARADEVIE